MHNDSSRKSCDREQQLRELKEQVRILQRQQDAEERERERERARTSAATKTPGSTPLTPASTTTTTTTTTTTSEVPVPDPGGLSADGIALRSTLRLLMLQRDRANSDIHSLEEMREAALKEPLEFVEFIQNQKARGRGSRTTDKKPNTFAGKELPKPQEIYKCPNIEWSQYKILGAPLDALHEKHLRRPSPSRPSGQAAAGVPPSMQTGGIIGMPEYGDESGVMQGRLRMFDGLVQRGSVVGR